MCDDEIHQGLNQDLTVSRRTFGIAAAAAVGLSAAQAHAQSKVVEKDVDIKTADGTADAALFYPEGKGTWPAVLIWTDILGLRPAFRDMGRRLAAQGYVVLVPNPFYRAQRAPIAGPNFDFNKPEDRAKVLPMAGALTEAVAMRDGAAFVAFLDAQPQTNKKAKVGVQGYCMGGPLTLRTAAAVPGRVGAGATFHGGGLATANADSPHLLAPKIKASLLIAVADNDDMREPEAKVTLKKALDAAKLPNTVEVYKGAQHGWCVKGSAVYNEASAEKAWAELTKLYKTALV